MNNNDSRKSRGKLDLVFDPVSRIIEKLTTLKAFQDMDVVEIKKIIFAILILILAAVYFIIAKENRYNAFKLTAFILVGFLILNLIFPLKRRRRKHSE